MQMHQMVVEPSLQGRGIGAALIDGLEKEALARGFRTMYAHARTSVRGFYEKYGYIEIAEDALPSGLSTVAAVGVPHIFMKKGLV